MPDFAQISKPTLLLDERIARANIARMAAKARTSQVDFRPHFKTHQSAEIGEWFRDQGVRAITVSSLDMAAYFADHGWDDITLAFPANLRQMGEMSRLAERIRLGLLVESAETARALAQGLNVPVDLWIKVDTGNGRTGIAWQDIGSAQSIVQVAESSHRLRMRGLLTHAGQSYAAASPIRAAEIFTQSTSRLDQLRQSLSQHTGLPLRISTGDTPGCSAVTNFAPADEIRPGNFVFFDAEQYLMGTCDWQDIAVALICPVVAVHPERNEVVVYGGAIHLSKDDYTHQGQRMYGLVSLPAPGADPASPAWMAPLPGAWVDRLSQEHGVLHVPPESLVHLKVGELVCILPVHSCLTAQCMRRYHSRSGNWIEMMPW